MPVVSVVMTFIRPRRRASGSAVEFTMLSTRLMPHARGVPLTVCLLPNCYLVDTVDWEIYAAFARQGEAQYVLAGIGRRGIVFKFAVGGYFYGVEYVPVPGIIGLDSEFGTFVGSLYVAFHAPAVMV